jgi:hypothetical protein
VRRCYDVRYAIPKFAVHIDTDCKPPPGMKAYVAPNSSSICTSFFFKSALYSPCVSRNPENEITANNQVNLHRHSGTFVGDCCNARTGSNQR